MKKRKIFLLWIFILSICFACTWKEKEKYVEPISFYFDEFGSFKALLDKDFIYLNLSEEGASYYRYHLLNHQKTLLGKIDNFYLATKSSALIDGKLYFYAAENDGTNISNTLFCIDCVKNELKAYRNQDDSLAGISTYKWNKDIITLKNRRDGNKITTYLDIFDTDLKTWTQKNVHLVDMDTHTGSAIFALYADKDTLYVLHDDLNGKDNVLTTLRAYNGNMEEIRTIPVDDKLKDYIFSSRIQEIAIFGEYIYMNNLSNDALWGKILEDRIEPLMKKTDLALALNQQAPDVPFLYVRWSNQCYLPDEKTGDLFPIELSVGNGYVLRCVLADKEHILLDFCAEDKKDFLYYVKKNNLKTAYFPCQ